MSPAPGVGTASGIVGVREHAVEDAPLPAFTHDWDVDPRIVHGATGRGREEPFDMGLFGATPVGTTLRRWRTLREWSGCPTAIHAHQVHGATVLRHAGAGAGIIVRDDADGHVTADDGILLTVSLADCVPIYVADVQGRAVALLHSGWRGTAAGILASGLDTLARHCAVLPADVAVHLGPAICGECYEVGPDVHAALGLPVPTAPATVDLRGVIASAALDLGVPPARISTSSHCTRCGEGGFFSHRAGHTARFVAFIGLRSAGAGRARRGD